MTSPCRVRCCTICQVLRRSACAMLYPFRLWSCLLYMPFDWQIHKVGGVGGRTSLEFLLSGPDQAAPPPGPGRKEFLEGLWPLQTSAWSVEKVSDPPNLRLEGRAGPVPPGLPTALV